MEDLNDLALFAAVVVHGSFSAAARALNTPKSRISRRVAELEQRLGVRLLQRSTRVVRVTEVGSAFFTHCEAMTHAARAAVEVTEHAGARPAGRLRVSSPMGVSHIFLAPLLARFLTAHPDVRLELELSNRRVDVIGEGIDVAMRVRSTLEDSNLVVRSFGTSHQILTASPDFVATHGPFGSVQALQGQRGLGPGGMPGEAARWRLQGADNAMVDVAYAPVLVTDDVHLMQAAAMGGAGLAVLPFNVCRQAIERGELVVVLPDYRAAAHQLHAVFPSRRGLVPAVRAFIEFLAVELSRTMQMENQALQDLLARQGAIGG
ncbi:LysR family transcriptional regulator [Herbaspirillum sp. AP02]|uniref:LysR substrate-binding domain-containing protein n=1 Tax=unclassified Herbaspirillum TaxID=2624150 RepID=UPI0015DB3343|nr:MULTISPECIES: LysR substrate-binding domain-containing protein [unclassified Herbaspirillum]MBG7621419.1 LysR family transcriptional regulator [Herbaspirillum sp. AP02]NZD66968.1 LysR family transcriptional regulator [Herbaspirillum sp. AP21]